MKLLLSILLLAMASPAIAQDKPAFRATDYPLPRFVTIASDRAYVRTGPDKRYPVKWVYQRDGLPVEVILEFDNWRKIRDRDGDEGWMHHSLLSGRRAVIINAEQTIVMHSAPGEGARAAAKIQPDVVASLKECTPVYCKIDANGFDGWVPRRYLWGVYEDERIGD